MGLSLPYYTYKIMFTLAAGENSPLLVPPQPPLSLLNRVIKYYYLGCSSVGEGRGRKIMLVAKKIKDCNVVWPR